MGLCAACRDAEGVSGYLCEECAASIHGASQLFPEQVVAHVAARSDAVLIDRWGRAHPLGPRTLVGREADHQSISIAEGSVSRRHAEIIRKPDGAFWLVDLVSSNGTTCDDRPVTMPVPLVSGAALFFGDVGVYFVSPPPTTDPRPVHSPQTHRPPEPEQESPELESPTRDRLPRLYDPEADEAEGLVDEGATFMGLRAVDLTLASPSGGGGGVVSVDGHTAQLTMVQYALVRALAERMGAEEALDERVRGFVRSSELLGVLPWDSPRPDDGHIKQLVRRVRRTLVRAQIGDLIESRQGFGYRLRVRLRRPLSM